MPISGTIFQNPASKIPTNDPQFVRVDMEQMDIGGRKSHLPNAQKATDMNVTHVSGNGMGSGGRRG
jgi:hypothetical protein